ncbi:MAG TPA: hypothetical protein VGM41_12550 [Chitinophagaceae bacterium]
MNRSKTFVPYYPTDRNFFLLLLLITWAVIGSGFGYEMVQMSRQGKLHFPPIVHIHAVAFVGWMVLFTVQILLVRTKNLALHKKLGLVSFGLVPLLLILGVLTVITTQRLLYGTPDGDLPFACVQLGDLLAFGCLAGAGLYLRKNYVAHKRLMLLATLVLTEPGFSRWFSLKIAPLFGDYFWNYKTLSLGYGRFWAYEAPAVILMLALGVYDLVTRKQLNKAYVWGVLFYALVTAIEGLLYYNDTWFALMKRMIGVA